MTKQVDFKQLGLSAEPNAHVFKSESTQGYWLELDAETALDMYHNCTAELCIFYDTNETMIQEEEELTDAIATGQMIAIYLGDIRKEEEE